MQTNPHILLLTTAWKYRWIRLVGLTWGWVCEEKEENKESRRGCWKSCCVHVGNVAQCLSLQSWIKVRQRFTVCLLCIGPLLLSAGSHLSIAFNRAEFYQIRSVRLWRHQTGAALIRACAAEVIQPIQQWSILLVSTVSTTLKTLPWLLTF